MEFSRQESWSGLPFPPLGDLPDPGTERMSLALPALQADSLPLHHLGSPYICVYIQIHCRKYPMAFFCTQTCVSFAEGPITYTPPSCLMVRSKSSELEMQPCHVLDMLLLLLLSCFSRVRLCAPHRRLPTRLCRP